MRGRDIKRYSYTFADKWIIATFPSLHYDIESYPAVKQWLQSAIWSDGVPDGHGQLKLEQTGATHVIDGVKFKSRKKTGNKWFETQDQIGYWDDFSKQKIMFQEMVQEPSFFLDETNLFCLDTGRIITGSNLVPLLTILNSKLFFFAIRCYYGGGGLGSTGIRMKHTFFEIFPAPPLSKDCLSKLFQLYAQITVGNNALGNIEKSINQIIYDSYNLQAEEVDFIESL